MSDLIDSTTLIGEEISLVCFAEYSCFIHLGKTLHVRVESSANVTVQASRHELFPHVEFAALKAVLGKNVASVQHGHDGLTLILDGGVALEIARSVGYESFRIEGVA